MYLRLKKNQKCFNTRKLCQKNNHFQTVFIFPKKKFERDEKFSITKFQLVNFERNFGIDGRIFFFKYLRFKLQFKFLI